MKPPDLPDDSLAGESQVMPNLTEDEELIARQNGMASTSQVPRVLSMDSTKAVKGDEVAEKMDPRDVWVHIYHCDDVTGFLNRMLLKDAEVGIYHAGIEVYGEEWSFQYFEDTWTDPHISGLIRCHPKGMGGYEYQESVNLGRTPLSKREVDRLLLSLNSEWPANSYHLTRHNCISFAEHLAIRLKAPEPFPAKLLGVLEASTQNKSLDAVVDYSWSWAKWWMIKKYEQAEPEQENSWFSFFTSVPSCTGVCPGPVKSVNKDELSAPDLPHPQAGYVENDVNMMEKLSPTHKDEMSTK